MPLARGTFVGPYEIVALIGAGGMGEVYRAHDARLRRDVAIKVLPAAFAADPERMRRFELEAHAAGGLSHPNIVVVHDTGVHEGSPYIVSELLLGETLRERLERGPVPVRRAIEYAVQIARGLSAAHQKGIAHRDLKPENVYLTDDGRLKILDFGLAKPVHALAAQAGAGLATTVIQATEPGMVFGTVGYMSPEQVRGVPADHRSDVFSLGLILYEMISGRRAFHGESSVETMNAILKDDLPEFSTPDRPVPPGLDRVVRHCVEKAPEDRFQTARDLAFALEALSGLSEVPEASLRRRKRSARWRTAAVLAAGIVLGAAMGAWLLRRPPAEPPAFRYLTYSGHDYSPAASPDGRFVAFTSERDGTPRIWLKQLPGGEEQPLTSGPDDFPRFSPDGSLVLFARTEGAATSLYRIGVLGGEPRRVVDNASEGDWSPDGQRIAFVRPRQGTDGRLVSILGTVEADGSDVREIATFPDRNLARLRWSPGGGTLAVMELGTGSNRPVWLVSADGKDKQELPTTRVISSFAWINGGREVLYFENESALEGGLGVSAGTAKVIRRGVPFGSIETLSWSPSSSMVLDILAPGTVVFDSCSPRASLRELSLNGPAPAGATWLTRGNANDRQPAYSPDGEWVVFSSNRSGNLDLWQVSRKSGVVRRLTEDEAEDWDPAFTPDGKHIVWSSNRSGVFEVWMAHADGSAARQITHDGFDAENPTVTADGRWIVYVSTNPAKAGIWKIQPDGSGAVRLIQGTFAMPEVSPDGRYALYSANYMKQRVPLRVVEIGTGASVPFEMDIAVPAGKPRVALGRARWMPGGKAIAFIGQDEQGVAGIYVQDFVPGKDTRATRRKLCGFDRELTTESFGISPDGSRIVIASWEQLFSLMLAERVPGVMPPQRAGR